MNEVEISPAGLRVGDRIRSAAKLVEVKEIQHNPPGCPGHVHVNRSACYDSLATLTVKR